MWANLSLIEPNTVHCLLERELFLIALSYNLLVLKTTTVYRLRFRYRDETGSENIQQYTLDVSRLLAP